MALLFGTTMEKKESALWRWAIEVVDLHMVNQGVSSVVHFNICYKIKIKFYF